MATKGHGVALKKPAGPVRRHLRWALPLVLGFAAHLALVPVLGDMTTELQRNPDDSELATRTVGVLAAWALALLVAAILSLVGALRTLGQWYRRRRRTAGHLTKAELAQRDQDNAALSSWDGAKRLRSDLLREQLPSPITVLNVVPHEGEEFYFDTSIRYARYYGKTVSYQQSAGLYVGSPSFVLAGLALTALSNSAQRSAAQAHAKEQWRDFQTVQLLISNQRLMCKAHGRWLSFYFSHVTAVYPQVEQWTLVCEFASAEPLMLHGLSGPLAAILTTHFTLGSDALHEHPDLHPLTQA
ncbi:MAG: hypothetical protein ACK5KU_10410 [Beutenbergiaceae bacterium]